MKFQIIGLDKVRKSWSQLAKQLDYVAMLTLNDLAFDSQKALTAEVKNGMKVRVNTSKAFAVDKATKKNLVATIRLKDDWHQDAIPQHFLGGEGAQIKFEKAMITRGYMTNKNSAVPLKKMGKAKYKTVLNATRRGIRSHSKMFVIPTSAKSHLRAGVWERGKKRPRLIIAFRDEAEYRKRFDMYKTVEKVFDRRATKYFYKNLKKAMKSAT